MSGIAAAMIWAVGLASGPTPPAHRTELLGAADGWRLESRCSPEACSPVLVSPTEGQPERVLPTVADDPPWAVDGVSLRTMKLVDLDGDGKAELRVDWRSSGTPRAALGSWHRDFTTVVDPRSGALRLHVETGSFGGASEMRCTGSIRFKGTQPSVHQSCQLRACLDGDARVGECTAGPQHTVRALAWMR